MENIVGESVIPCYEVHDPHHIEDDDALDALYEICPELSAGKENPLLCCGPDQIYAMQESFKIPMQLGLSRCPSCLHNWRTNFCQSTCSPNQSDFLKVSSAPMSDGRLKVSSLDYYVHSNYSEGLFDSCKGVQGLATGTYLLDLMCGQHGHSGCTGEKWLDFMGLSTDNGGQAPYQINYHVEYKDEVEVSGIRYKPMNVDTFKCSEKPSGSSHICSCTDCEETCKARVLPDNARRLPDRVDPFTVMEISGTLVIGWILFFLFMAAICIHFALDAFKRKRTFNHDFSPACRSPPVYAPSKHCEAVGGAVSTTFETSTNEIELDFGLKLERFFENAFRRWGRAVAMKPVLVLVLALIASFGLGIGLCWWKVTTDPVDLWVSPTSKARLDMEYFNEHFWKFYRIQQVVIAPLDQEIFHKEHTGLSGNAVDKKTETFGPAFKQDFMLQVLRLQQAIEGLTVKDGNNRSITLDSICFKPLDKDCATQSIFTYFMDDETKVSADDYVRRISVCTR